MVMQGICPNKFWTIVEGISDFGPDICDMTSTFQIHDRNK